MQKTRLGSSKMEVSRLCLGTMYFGTKIDKSGAFQLLNHYYEQGGNFIDTANNYAWWIGGTGDESELLIGDWLREKGNRENIVLCSKIGSRPRNIKNGDDSREGLKKETIVDAVEGSLKRLSTEYLDLCYIHADLQEYPLEERLDALDQLQAQGKIRLKGCSNISTDRLEQMLLINQNLDYDSFQAVQQKYSYLVPDKIDDNDVLKFLDDEMIELASQNQLSILTYSVLLSGAYERGFDSLPESHRTVQNKLKFEKLDRLSKDTGYKKSELVLNHLLNRSDRIIPIIAASSISQLNQNLNALNLKQDHFMELQ